MEIKNDREFKGVWIPREIWLDTNLNWSEKVLLVEIDSLSSLEMGCFATNDYFGKFFGLSKDRISKLIASLKNKGYIEVQLLYKEGSKEVDKRIITTRGYKLKCLEGIGINNYKGIVENNQDNNTTNNNTDINTDINTDYLPVVKEKKSILTEVEDLDIGSRLKRKLYDFIQYRKEIKKPIKTIRSIKTAINQIGKEYKDEEHLIESIESSIANGYQGIFPTKNYRPVQQGVNDRMKYMEKLIGG